MHTNSSLLNRIAYQLYKEGMTIPELKDLFSGVICAMIPTSGNAEMVQVLLYSAKISGLEKYSDTIQKVCDEIGYGIQGNTLIRVPDGYGRLIMEIPESDDYTMGDLQVLAVDFMGSMMNVISSMMGNLMSMSAAIGGGEMPDLSSLMSMGADTADGEMPDLSNLPDLPDLPDLSDMSDQTTMGELIMKNAIVSWPDGETGHLMMTLPAGNYTVMIMSFAKDPINGETITWNGSAWTKESMNADANADDLESSMGSLNTFHVDAGCETWIPSTGIAEAFSTADDADLFADLFSGLF